MAFPHGVVPTIVPVDPTPLYEALAAVAIAAVLGDGQALEPDSRIRRVRRPELG